MAIEGNNDRAFEPAPPKPGNPKARVALILGLLSFVLGITALPGIFFSILGLRKSKTTGTGKGMALIGLFASFGGLFIGFMYAYFGWVLYINYTRGNEAFHPKHNMALIGAGWNKTSTEGGKDYTMDGNFHPTNVELSERLSWRVAMLPYLNQEDLYGRFLCDQAWSSSNNKPLSQTVVKNFTDYDSQDDPNTRYRVFFGGGALFDADTPTTLEMVKDGTSNTIMVVESGDKVPWSQSNEIPYRAGNVPALGQANSSVIHAVFADGSVRYIRKTVDPIVLNAAITRAGGEAFLGQEIEK